MHSFEKPRKDQVTALLSACGLPFEDLDCGHLGHFFGCGDGDEPDGVIGVEIYGHDALLRSLAVTEAARGRGYGTKLVAIVEQYAASRGVHDVYLLTTSARTLFEALGYREASRESAPDSIKKTREFASICPDTATFMRKSLLYALTE